MDNGLVTSNMTDVTPILPTETTEAPALQGQALVDATWAEIGHKVRPIQNKVYVRTDVPPQKIGMVYMPAEMWGQYGQRLGSKVFVTATVLATGPAVKDAPDIGTKVVFSRLMFGWSYKMADGTHVGWIDANEIIGVAEEGDVIPYFAGV